jgi:phosphohistidine phosphatase
LRTAEIVARVFDAEKKLTVCETLAVGGDPQELVQQLQERHRSAVEVMLVGHEPYLSELISVLLTGHTDLPLNLKKGGLCKLSLTRLRYGKCATLEWLVAPRLMAGR